MTVDYKYCKRCGTKVSINSSECIVCDGREFSTQEEVDQTTKDVIDYIVSVQDHNRLQRALNLSITLNIILFISLLLIIYFTGS